MAIAREAGTAGMFNRYTPSPSGCIRIMPTSWWSPLLCVLLIACSHGVWAQDVPFHPRYDAIDDNKPKRSKTPPVEEAAKPQGVYSFSRFGFSFQVTCRALEADGRQTRIYQISKTALVEEYTCTTCRALYRQFVSLCAPKLVKKTPVKKRPTPTPIPSVVPEGEESASAQSQPLATNPQQTPTVAPVPEVSAPNNQQEAPRQPARYPRTDLIDAVSRISAGLYDLEPDNGSTFKALENFQNRLLSSPNLTPAEKDYYGVMMAYLFSAWEGRPNSPLNPRVKANEDVSVLFQ